MRVLKGALIIPVPTKIDDKVLLVYFITGHGEKTFVCMTNVPILLYVKYSLSGTKFIHMLNNQCSYRYTRIYTVGIQLLIHQL